MSNKQIVIIGDRSSKHNLDKNVPFVGTKSFKTLQAWIKALELQDYQIYNAYTEHGTANILPSEGIFIALGANASKALKGRQHFKLPHPSGLNRKLNNKIWLQQQLEACRLWLNKEKL